MVGSAIMHANRNETSPLTSFTGDYIPALETQLQNYTGLTGKDVRFESVSVNGNAKFINDSAPTTNDFNSATGASNWLVAEDIEDIRALQLHVRSAGSSVSGPRWGPLGAFTINVTHRFPGAGSSGEDVFQIRIGKSSGHPAVRVMNETNSMICTLPDRSYPLDVDVMNARFGGEYCAALDVFTFGEGVNPGYNLYFNKTSQIDGNISLVTKGGTINNPASHYGSALRDPKFRGVSETIIYAATVDVAIRTGDVTVEKEIRVAPKED